MDNVLFGFGSKVFEQVLCIPMRSVPFMANLFLVYYEGKCIRKEKWKDLIQARKFSNMSRFIVDLSVVINAGGEFGKVYHGIYPPKLQLRRENSSENEASFLDLDIKIINKKFSQERLLSFFCCKNAISVEFRHVLR